MPWVQAPAVAATGQIYTTGSTVNYIPSLGNTTSYNASVLTGGTS